MSVSLHPTCPLVVQWKKKMHLVHSKPGHGYNEGRTAQISITGSSLQAPSLMPNLPKRDTQRHKKLERAQTESKIAGRQLQRSSNMMGYREEARPCGHPHYSLLARDRGQFYSQQSRWPRQLKVTSE